MFSRGSEWNKWDLHVHSPESVLCNDFSCSWDDYVVSLFSKALEENVAVIGITDYYSIDGYKKLKTDYLNRPEVMESLFFRDDLEKIKEILVIPNIEFRLKSFINTSSRDLSRLNRKLNFHVLLSEEIPIRDIESNFLHQLKFDFSSCVEGGHERRSLTRRNLEELGKRLKSEHSEFAESGKSDLYIGMLNAAVEESAIKELLDSSIFRGKYLLGINADEDLSEVSWNSQGHLARKNLLKGAHFAFSSNPNTARFMLGEFHSPKESFQREFGPAKPCLWGSDAHSIDTLFKPKDNRFTWAKAEPTFDGLKQVIYDPTLRARIQENSPVEKLTYQTIRRVRYLDKRAEKQFGEDWIPISKDLTTIIGGKSSGKSMLLYLVAKTIDQREAERRCEVAGSSVYSALTNTPDFDFEVEWDNGDRDSLRSTDGQKRVTYIPQLYINQLSEKDGRSHLNNLVEDIICQNSDMKTHLSNRDKELSEIRSLLKNHIASFFMLRAKNDALKDQLKEYGDKEAILKEIDRLKKLADDLRKISGFSREDELKYHALTRRRECLQLRRKRLLDIVSVSTHIQDLIVKKSEELPDSVRRHATAESELSTKSSFAESVVSRFSYEIDGAVSSTLIYIDEKTEKVPDLVEKISDKLEFIENRISPYDGKIRDKHALAAAEDRLLEEQKKVEHVKSLDSAIENVKNQGAETLKEINKLYRDLICLYQSTENELARPEYGTVGDLKIFAKTKLREDIFREFLGLFDGRRNLSIYFPEVMDEHGDISFNENQHAYFVSEIFKKIARREGLPSYRRGVNDEQAVERLFQDCFYTEYAIEYNGDEITRMSPGKRGLVLLNLTLQLSNATHPILIDQPEDNLDNRTIYNQLRSFIRQKKQERQVIMVTHNANLVVSADADCVIVANQDGQTGNGENAHHQFEFCSGGIENSFELNSNVSGILYQKGIRQHICEVLEGGVDAFREREIKYGLKH